MPRPAQELFAELHCGGSSWACVTIGVKATVRRARNVEYIGGGSAEIGGLTRAFIRGFP